MSVFVTRYMVERRYGGPEEGGWWWDCWHAPHAVAMFSELDEAQAACRGLNANAREQKDKPDRSSVIGTPDLVYACEDVVGEHTTWTRPHYE